MNIEVVTERSVLVELSEAELSAWELSYETMNDHNEQAKAAFRTILCEIHRQTGRALLPQALEIDLLPSRGGGCLMIVSATGERQFQHGALVCTITSTDALLDFFATMQRFHKIAALIDGYKRRDAYDLIVGESAQETLLLLREFGTVWRADDVEIARIKETGERLKIFCGSSTQI